MNYNQMGNIFLIIDWMLFIFTLVFLDGMQEIVMIVISIIIGIIGYNLSKFNINVDTKK